MDRSGRYSSQHGRTDADSAYAHKDLGPLAPGPDVRKKKFPVSRASRPTKRPKRKRQTYRPEVIRLLGAPRGQ